MQSLNFISKLGRVVFVVVAPAIFATSAIAQDAVPPAAPADAPAAVMQPEPAPGAEAPTKKAPSATVGTTAAPSSSASGTLTLSMSEFVGKTVVDAQGKKVGIVTDVKKSKAGKIKALHVRTDGLFGFFAKTLVVPAVAITETKASVKLNLASADVGKLAVIKPKS